MAQSLHRELWLPRPLPEIWDFFSAARNLEEITPPWLKFEVLTPEPIVMRTGLLIDYRIRLHGIPIRWRTEIVDWQPPHRFVDMQLSGPYRLWHHTHTFTERDGGTFCTDDVQYQPIGGALMARLFVQRDVEAIFDYRAEVLQRKFGEASSRGKAASP